MYVLHEELHPYEGLDEFNVLGVFASMSAAQELMREKWTEALDTYGVGPGENQFGYETELCETYAIVDNGDDVLRFYIIKHEVQITP